MYLYLKALKYVFGFIYISILKRFTVFCLSILMYIQLYTITCLFQEKIYTTKKKKSRFKNIEANYSYMKK